MADIIPWDSTALAPAGDNTALAPANSADGALVMNNEPRCDECGLPMWYHTWLPRMKCPPPGFVLTAPTSIPDHMKPNRPDTVLPVPRWAP